MEVIIIGIGVVLLITLFLGLSFLKYRRETITSLDVHEKEVEVDARYFISVTYIDGKTKLLAKEPLTEEQVYKVGGEFMDNYFERKKSFVGKIIARFSKKDLDK